jgi:hypothetical protein
MIEESMKLDFIHEGYLESNLRYTVNRTRNGKKILYTKNTYTLKLLLNIITAKTEALVLANKFLYASVRRLPPVSKAMF